MFLKYLCLLIVEIVSASNPVIGSSVTESCLLAGETVVHTSQVNYAGSVYMQPVISWTNSTGHLVSSNSSNSAGTFVSTIYITATTSYIPPYTCNVTFNAPTGDTLPSNPTTQATNAPSYNNISQTTTYNVQYCPVIVNIMFLNGTEFPGGNLTEVTTLNCSVSGGTSQISTSYNWTGSANSLTQTVVVPSGNYSLTCTATSSLCGTKFCTLTTTVTGHQNGYTSTTTTTTSSTSSGSSAASTLSCSSCCPTCPETTTCHTEDNYRSSTIALGVMFGLTTLSTIALAVVVYYQHRQLKSHHQSRGPTNSVTDGDINFTDIQQQQQQQQQPAGHYEPIRVGVQGNSVYQELAHHNGSTQHATVN